MIFVRSDLSSSSRSPPTNFTFFLIFNVLSKYCMTDFYNICYSSNRSSFERLDTDKILKKIRIQQDPNLEHKVEKFCHFSTGYWK
jgi:ribosome biogenesis GTPase A